MPTYTCKYRLPSGNRSHKRQALISCFLNEEAGIGRGDEASRYQYNVESYEGYGIFLKRPTQLNKGFDFTVNVQGMYFKKNRRYSNPSHNDIFEALVCCRDECPEEYDAVKSAIIAIYECDDIDLSHIEAFFLDYEGRQRPIQIILLAIKWLFMEQDCAYWNYSGRQMLFDGLAERGLV
ncbi:MAG: DNA adenine methylase [Bacillota bacterium]|nr:DNA adenine methylase [Bacillota bacterium]